MKNRSENSHPLVRQEGADKKIILPGYPTYPDKEDIYKQCKEELEIDPEDITKTKDNIIVGETNELDFDEDMSGGDLDIPGSELDDNEEEIGSEDEENNYYSLGGENHENLDENSGR